MAKKTIYVHEAQKGDFLFWTVATQCLNLATVVICDDQTVYARLAKTSSSTDLQVLGQSTKPYTGASGLRVEIDIPAAQSISVASEAAVPIMGDREVVGYCYNFCVEDYVDNDYNDVYINLVAWHKKG